MLNQAHANRELHVLDAIRLEHENITIGRFLTEAMKKGQKHGYMVECRIAPIFIQVAGVAISNIV